MADTQQTLGTVAAAVGDVGPDRGGLHDETAAKAIDRAHMPLSGLEDDPEFAHRETFHGLYVATDEEKRTLRRVAGKMPSSCYYLCAVEFAERASYYGCNQVYKQFIRAPLPPGSTTGRTPPGTRFNPGALGLGSQVATAMTEAFKFMAYALPVFFGWLADAKYGRFKMICWGVGICGIAHVIMIISALPPVLTSGKAVGPFAFSLYLLAIGAAQFKPNISPTIMDQSPHKVAHVIKDKNGEKVVVDPEESIASIMLWFYLLINIGSCFGIPTSYLAKLVGYWAAYLIPTIVYLMLPPLLWYLNTRLIKQPAGGSDLGNVFRVIADVFRHGGFRMIGRKGFWEIGKPSVRRAAGSTREYPYDDNFVNDVRRTFQACGIFLFQPIIGLNDGGIGAAANTLTAGMDAHGMPNDLLDNLNPVSIVVLVPIMNHIIYPALRRAGIRFGPISRMTFGFAMTTLGSIAYSVLAHRVYQTSPCGDRASGCTETELGDAGFSTVHIGLYAIPTVVTAMAEVFINVTAYGIAYTQSPKNMKGLVASVNLFMSAISSILSLATSAAIRDPYLPWVFAAPTIAGAFITVAFWFTFRHLDHQEFVINTDFDDMKLDSEVSDEEAAARNEKNTALPAATAQPVNSKSDDDEISPNAKA
ncbi:putative peptide transporter PTR2 [Apiospora kogelbergensis]|uniref:Peptide transporter PTR2 n=1 Tax=Apiospora kogelbergensis TaxID=1337665 RepID=A0AAW0QC74_9PEZI